MKPTLWILCLCWCLGLAFAQNKTIGTTQLSTSTERRLALVIGMSEYKHIRPLKNPPNDADDMEAVLKQLGFEVISIKNKGLGYTQAEIDKFIATLRPNDVVFFYFSGHGVGYKGDNYLLPIDARIECLEEIPKFGFSINQLQAIFRTKRVRNNFLVLDACRSLDQDMYACNSTGKDVFSAKGLVLPQNQMEGDAILYATQQGEVADDNIQQRNGLFTQVLMKYLLMPNLNLFQIMTRTTREVRDESLRRMAQNKMKARQLPAIYGNLGLEFVFIKTDKQVEDPKIIKSRDENLILSESEKLRLQLDYPRQPTTILDNTRTTPTRPTVDLPFMEMVFVKGGTFKMGSNDGESDEKPVHNVTVSSFLMGKYEVTVEQFAAFVAATNYKTDAEKGGSSRLWNPKTNLWYDSTGIHWRHDANGKLLSAREYNHSVVHVSHNDAVAFCGWLSKKESKTYRLPTEAEWEYAAGNGIKHTKYSWEGETPKGNVTDKTFATTFNGSKTYTIFEGYTDSYATTAPVGSFDANICGLHDMTGNVWEWCADWFADDWYAQASARRPNTNNQTHGSKTFRVLRGGSWFSTPSFARVSNRSHNTPSHRSNDYGFRVVSPSQ